MGLPTSSRFPITYYFKSPALRDFFICKAKAFPLGGRWAANAARMRDGCEAA